MSKLKHIVDERGQWKSPFTANGRKYYVRSPEDGIGIIRYQELSKMLSVVGWDASFAEQAARLDEAIQYANTIGGTKPQVVQLATTLVNMRESIRKSERKWGASLYTAALFIIREGEDITKWEPEMADEKIADWNKEQIHEQDFFFLVMSWALNSHEWLKTGRNRLQTMFAGVTR